MKKIGLITIHDIFNYGSILQTYASQNILEKFGYNVEIIDYKYPNKFHKQTKSTKGKILNWVNSIAKSLLPGNPYYQYKKNYTTFKKKWYKLSERRYNSIEEIESAPKYDLYVAGSDQIWRTEFTKMDPSFFLGFAPNGSKKISFASSFGSKYPPKEHIHKITSLLLDFSFISVRESQGLKIIKDLTGKEASLVLDPTLLLSKDEWHEVMTPTKINEPYILCYGLNLNDKYMEKLALYIKELTGYKIIRLNGKAYDYFNRSITYVLDAGPSEWLSYFSNASFILAQSFHATAFAINFERPFLSILRGDEDHDVRQRNILNILNLEDRAITLNDPFPSIDRIKQPINYKEVIKKLLIEREKSLQFLSNALGA